MNHQSSIINYNNPANGGIIVVTGPTASGKTTLGIKLAQKLNGAVISADSRMIYKRLDIGTGKPTWEHAQLKHSPWIKPRLSDFGPIYTIENVDHYGLDLVNQETKFSLNDWLKFVRPLIKHLQKINVQPIIVGGTGLYIKSLVEGYNPPPTDLKIRAEIEQLSNDQIIFELKKVDPTTVKREKANRRRLVRALEVFKLTGRSISKVKNNPINSIIIAPKLSRQKLYQNIDKRIDDRLNAGMVKEVQSLIIEKISIEWLKSLGLEYRIVTNWLESQNLTLPNKHFSSENREVLKIWDKLDSLHKSELDELKETLKGAIHAYARRQLTFFRHQLNVNWVNDLDEALSLSINSVSK